jgi:hypothetical protein
MEDDEMATFNLRNELVFRAPDRIGLLSDVADRLLGHGVNVLALRGYEEEGEAVVLVYADDSQLARRALEELDGETGAAPAIVARVPNRPGELAAITSALSNANIEITQVYATTFPECDEAVIVMHTANDVRAIDVLQKL